MSDPLRDVIRNKDAIWRRMFAVTEAGAGGTELEFGCAIGHALVYDANGLGMHVPAQLMLCRAGGLSLR